VDSGLICEIIPRIDDAPPTCHERLDTASLVRVQVLLVDDQVAFRRAAARVLGRMPDFQLLAEAATGEASVQVARELRPDLVLMDVHLPGIDGPEATRRILAEAAPGQSQPVVFLLSTYEVADYGAQTAACGAAAYLPKADFSAATLQAAWSVINPPRSTRMA
jgi:DNA-binding NarL/FixJ family response regulator